MSRNLFRKKQNRVGAVAVQTGSLSRHPFASLANYTPLADGSTPVYRALREAVPLIDAAIGKLARLRRRKDYYHRQAGAPDAGLFRRHGQRRAEQIAWPPSAGHPGGRQRTRHPRLYIQLF